jgi:hypothetical protein
MRGVSKDYPVDRETVGTTLRYPLERPSRPLRGASGRGRLGRLSNTNFFFDTPLRIPQ